MITFTKEQLIASAHARIEFAEMMLAGELEPLTERTLSIELELSRRALASLGAEPVAFVMADDLKDSSIISTPAYRDLGEAMERTVGDVVALYASPLAPVSVHDERYQHLSEIYHAQEKRLFKLAQRIKGPSFDKYAYSPSQAIDVLESAIFGESAEEDSLAAMLQGAEPVSNRDELPVWVACSERMPEEGSKVIVFRPRAEESNDPPVKTATYKGGREYYHGFDCYCEPTHWMPLPAAPQQEVKP